jgi:hypothetical protein
MLDVSTLDYTARVLGVGSGLATPSISQSSHRKGWLFARSEALAVAHRAMNALAPSEDTARRMKAEHHCLQAIRSLRGLHPIREAQDLRLSGALPSPHSAL